MKIRVNKTCELTLNVPKKLKPKQKYYIKKLTDAKDYSLTDIIRKTSTYIESLNGTQVENQNLKSYISPLRPGNDTLWDARKNALLKKDKSTRIMDIRPNFYLRQQLKHFHPINARKTPDYILPSKAIGVEIECIIPIKWREDLVSDEIIVRKIADVNMKHDGSISSYDDNKFYSQEFTIITSIENMSNLEKLCILLKDIGAIVNKSCGMHIHLDQRDLTKYDDFLNRNVIDKEVYIKANRLEWALPLLTKMLPKSRLENQRYCKYGQSPTCDNDDHRYYMINTVALKKYNTIEVRMHSATLNFNKIRQWIEICYAVSNCKGQRFKALPNITDNNSLNEAFMMLNKKVSLKDSLIEYMFKRIKLFNPQLFEASQADTSELEGSEDLPVNAQVVENELYTINRETDEMIIRMPNIVFNSDNQLSRRPGTNHDLFGIPRGAQSDAAQMTATLNVENMQQAIDHATQNYRIEVSPNYIVSAIDDLNDDDLPF